MKSLNLLVDDNFHIKLADFGLSLDKSSRLNTKMGTLNWVAPECLDGDTPYDEKADMYRYVFTTSFRFDPLGLTHFCYR